MTKTITEPPADPSPISKTFPAVRIRQPIGDMYVCTMTHDVIQKITFFDVRRVLQEFRDVERYLGIQRPLRDNRVDEIKKYVNYRDATFPGSIILAVDDSYAQYNEKKREITISNMKEGDVKPSIAFSYLCRVLDGQHRIAGLAGFTGKVFEVPVSLFVGSDIADQAYVFATVNLQQNKVNKSLAFDLFELAKTRSPAKTCHNIAVALDQTSGSPFYRRIKRLGVATAGRAHAEETITQATFVSALLPYISKDPAGDRDILLRGKSPSPASEADALKLCLRDLFLSGHDKEIGKILEQYFVAVAERWPVAWSVGGKGLILNRTNGFQALMSIFGRLYNSFNRPSQLVSSAQYLSRLKQVDVDDNYFNVDNFKPGTSGESGLKRLFVTKLKLGN